MTDLPKHIDLAEATHRRVAARKVAWSKKRLNDVIEELLDRDDDYHGLPTVTSGIRKHARTNKGAPHHKN